MNPQDDREEGNRRAEREDERRQGRRGATRSRLCYGTSLRLKLVATTVLMSCVIVGTLFWFAFSSLHSSIQSIYEQRARSVAALISKSIRDTDYVLYYSDALDAEIRSLLGRYEGILGIRVIGTTARGLVVVASTDPTVVGEPVPEDVAMLYETMNDVSVQGAKLGERDVLRALSPITSGTENMGIVAVDMSLNERDAYVRRLSSSFAAAAVGGFLLLGGLIYLALTAFVTRPVRRLARAAAAITERNFDLVPLPAPGLVPGASVRDEVCGLENSFRLMAKVIQAHEQELAKLVVLDEVTGVYNVAHFRTQLALELAKGRRYRHPTSLVLVEVEGLDERSAADADAVRVRTAVLLLAGLRRVDVVFRTGRHTFAALLPETPSEGARRAADRLREHAADASLHADLPASVRVTSLGWGPDEQTSVDAILRQIGIESEDSSE